MRIAGLLPLILFAAVPSHAVCRYFRTEYRLLTCEALPSVDTTKTVPPTAETTASSMTVETDDLPGLEEAPVGPSVSIVCSCDYVLKGADALCEPDRTQEFRSTEGVSDVVAACRPAKSLCATRCPKSIS